MSIAESRVKAAARILADAWQHGALVPGLPRELFPATIAESVAIQAEVARLLGEPVVGWKVGGAPGPLVGRVYASRLYATPAALPRWQFPAAGVECEIGFRLLGDLPARSTAYAVEEVADAAVLAFTIELTGSRYVDGKVSAETDDELRALVADNAAGAGLVVGPEVDRWRDLTLLDIPVELRINGGPQIAPNPLAKRTDPLVVLVWLANELSRRGIGLAGGQYVTTGSATLPQPLRPGDEATARYGSYGEIRCTVS